MLKIGAATLLYFAVIFSAHATSARNEGGGLKRLLTLCGQSLLHAESFTNLHDAAKQSEAAAASAKKHEASTRTLKERLIPYFQNAIKVFKFKFNSDLFTSGKAHPEIAFDFALTLLEHSTLNEKIFQSLEESFRRIFEETHKNVGDNLHLALDSTLGNTNEVLRFIVVSAPQQNLFFIRIEHRFRETGLLSASESNSMAAESINVEVYKDHLGQWQGIATHSADQKKQPKLQFKLDETSLTATGMTSNVSNPKILDIRNKEDEASAFQFILNLSREKGRSPFPSVMLVPQLPKDSNKASRYRGLMKTYGTFAHQIKFSSFNDLKLFLKRFLKEDLADAKNVPADLITVLMNQVEDGLPTLVVIHPGKKYLVTPSLLKDGVPTEHEVAAGLAASFNDFAEHGRLAHQVHQSAHPSLQKHSAPADEKLDENSPAQDPESRNEDETTPTEERTDENTNPVAIEELPHLPKSQAELQLEKALLELAQQKERIAQLEKELSEERLEAQQRAENLALELAAADEKTHLTTIAELESRLRQSRGAEMNLLTKVRQFEESGSLTPAQLKKLRSLEAQGMRTVSNAVQLAEALHPGSFELTKQAADQLARFSVSDAKDQYFAQEIYSSLISLWHILWAPDAPVIREQKQILFKQLSGLEIAFDETPVTREKLRAQKERTFLYGDKEFVAWPHIKLSNSRRIYFAIDTENRRTLIFSWPEHLWTQVDGSSK